MIVKNVFPVDESPSTYRTAFVGEAPGADEDATGVPFVGAAGRFLTSLMIEAGFDRKKCFIGNVCQIRPPANKISEFSWDGPEIQMGIQQLALDLDQFKPNLVVLLGAAALRAARGLELTDGKMKPPSIANWRGSLFKPDSGPLAGLKCMATFHPSYLFRVYEDIPKVKFDLKRARRHATTPDYVEPQLDLLVFPSFDEVMFRLEELQRTKPLVSCDIEGGVDSMSCISFAPTDNSAFIVPFMMQSGARLWTAEQEETLWIKLSEVLGDPTIPKVLQNGMYDRFVLQYSYKIVVEGVVDDTMLKHWELYCELEKALGVQVSLYTDHPFYKQERKTDDDETFYSYCCKDSCYTREINGKLEKVITGPSRVHYKFNINLLNPFLYIELRGMRLDVDKKNERLEELDQKLLLEQSKLNDLANGPINVNSPKQMQELLYGQLKLPVKVKRGTGRPTADYETLLKYAKSYDFPVLYQAINVRQLSKRISGIRSLTPDADGRIRSSINVVGAATGRTTSSGAPTGRGTNLQTVTSADRDLIAADPEHYIAQCDLEGADGWTVAAHCARLGDSTMLDDYRAGLKPAKILALMVLHGSEAGALPRERLKELAKNINSNTDPDNGYIYFACKRIQHGTNYRMGLDTLVLQIFLDSEGLINLDRQRAGLIQRLYYNRYPGIKRWQAWVEKELKTKGYIIRASGSKRLFFGRKDAGPTVNAACADEPQHNTTWITNKALLKLWMDPDNRIGNQLRIWPCHHVHDALILQWLQYELEFAREKLPYFFDNLVVIAGTQLTIPYDGGYGLNWQQTKNPI